MHAFQRKSLHAVLLLSLGGAGCDLFGGGEEEPKDTTPPKNVVVTLVSPGTGSQLWEFKATAEDEGKLAKAEFEFDGGPACTAEGPRNSGESFSCNWDATGKAPGAHQVTARVYDAAGNVTTSAPVALTLSDPSNHAPTITGLLATPSALDERASTSLSVTASDEDGDTLTYSWSQLPASPAGTFGSETGATRTWTAPCIPSNTTFTLQVTVSDGRGGSANATVDVAVADAGNCAPTVAAAITVATPAIAGDINLSIGATDPEGDPLTYAWSTSVAGQGTFATPTASATRWLSPDVATATTYTFQVTVSDGTSSVTRSLDVQVNVPEYTRDIQPIWNAQCTSCHSSGGRGGLNLLMGSSYASLVNTNAAGLPCGPTGRKRVVPSQPDNSLLVAKLTLTPGCGDRMPQGNPSYFDNNAGELTRIRSWILAGAPNN